MADAILEAEHLSKQYGRRHAVDNLSFSVMPGEIYGFLGRNGAGKSTTIRMILGLVRATAGKVRIKGRSVRAGFNRRACPVGAIVESPIFYEYLTARRNLEILTSISGGAKPSEIDGVLQLVGLRERQHEKVGTFSHGMRQRLGLAQALLPRPELMILDEPLDGLDPNGIRDLREVMLNVSRQHGVTIFLSSHILSEIEMTCDRVLVIHQGRRVFEGTTHELVSDSTSVRLRTTEEVDASTILAKLPFIAQFENQGSQYLMQLPHARVPELNRALVQAGVEVMELTPLKQKLEDVFIDLTSESPVREAEDKS